MDLFARIPREVWELAERRLVFIVERPESAGHERHTIVVVTRRFFEALTAEPRR